MPYVASASKVNKKFESIPQTKFPVGYVSTLSGPRVPMTALTKMQNVWLEQDAIPRPRPGFWNYGSQATNPILGIGTFAKIVAGASVYYEISMQDNGTYGQIFTRKDGATWTAVSGSDVFSRTAPVSFAQASILSSTGSEDRRVYIANGVQNLSFYDLIANTVTSATSISAPSAPTLTPTGLTGTNFTAYYAVTALTAYGETNASTATSQATSTARDFWTPATEYITVSWSAVSRATGYNVYYGNVSGQLNLVTQVTGLTFKDDGSITPSMYTVPSSTNNSAGPVVSQVVNIANTLYGTGDPNHVQRIYYSGSGQSLGNFSSYIGGWVDVDFGGSTIPTAIFTFPSGTGSTYPSVLTYAPNGRGKLYHIVFSSQTVSSTTGDFTLEIPNILESASKDGTPAPSGVSVYNNSAYYLTGTMFKTTGIKPGVINILSTDSISNQFLPDLKRINQSYLSNVQALEVDGRIYFSLAVDGSATNNVIWILDMTRNGLWILEWRIRADKMWQYQDNSGIIHFCILNNNVEMELDLNRVNPMHADNGYAFTAVVNSGDIIFGKSGTEMFSSYHTYFKLLNPQGSIQTEIQYLDQDNNIQTISQSVVVTLTNGSTKTAWDDMTWSNPNAQSPRGWSSTVASVIFPTVGSTVVDMEVSNIINQQRWSIATNTIGTDYMLSAINITGYTIPMLYQQQTIGV